MAKYVDMNKYIYEKLSNKQISNSVAFHIFKNSDPQWQSLTII